jgi:predicted short-subunit dehydrogenase-like oxidoreductase (DUF2520 family)
MTRLSVVGAGRVGQTIARLFHSSGHDVVDVFCRDAAHARTAAEFIGAGAAANDLEALALDRIDLLLITPPDDAITACATSLASRAPDLTGVTACHCSGSLSAQLLGPLQSLGAEIGSVHPIKSFADPAIAADTFAGTYCAVEGPDELGELFRSIGAIPFPIASETKALYHAAIVFACNYLYTLEHIGLDVLREIGVPETITLDALAPLMHETVANGLKLGPAAALTGPIARGDEGVVAKHLAAITDRLPRHRDVYIALAEATSAMAREGGRIDGPALERITDILNSYKEHP